MYETAPDAPDIEEYEADLERESRRRKRIAAMYDQEEMRREEEIIEDGY